VTAGLWFMVAALCAAFVLAVAGGVCLAREARALVLRAMSIEPPALNLEGARRSLERLQSDVEAMTELLVRMQAALRDIESGMRAMMRAFSRE